MPYVIPLGWPPGGAPTSNVTDADGVRTATYSNGIVIVYQPDGSSVTRYPNGASVARNSRREVIEPVVKSSAPTTRDIGRFLSLSEVLGVFVKGYFNTVTGRKISQSWSKTDEGGSSTDTYEAEEDLTPEQKVELASNKANIDRLGSIWQAACIRIDGYARNAPWPLKNEALLRLCGFAMDGPGPAQAGAFMHSGAKSILSPYRNRRVLGAA